MSLPKFLALCLFVCLIYRFVSCLFVVAFLAFLFVFISDSFSFHNHCFFLDNLSLFNSWLSKDSSIKNLCTPYLVCKCMYEVWRLEMGWVLDLSLRFRKICISIKLLFIPFLFSFLCSMFNKFYILLQHKFCIKICINCRFLLNSIIEVCTLQCNKCA